jgi:hypothetical protein
MDRELLNTVVANALEIRTLRLNQPIAQTEINTIGDAIGSTQSKIDVAKIMLNTKALINIRVPDTNDRQDYLEVLLAIVDAN